MFHFISNFYFSFTCHRDPLSLKEGHSDRETERQTAQHDFDSCLAIPCTVVLMTFLPCTFSSDILADATVSLVLAITVLECT